MKTFPYALGLFLVLSILVGCVDDASQPSPVTSLVDFHWRQSLLLGDTGVLQITNKTGKPTPTLLLDYKSQDSGEKLTYCVDAIGPYATVEVGVLESGWAIEPNEVVTVSATGYTPRSLYFYKDKKGEMIMSPGYAAKKAHQIGESIHDALK
jgi:hypothetical protein